MTAFDMAASSHVLWVMAYPGIAQDPAVLRALYYLAFTFGGVGFSVPMGRLIAGVCVPAAFMKLLPKWLVVFGLAFAVIGEFSVLNLVFPKAPFLIPFTRVPAFIWLIVAGFMLPNRALHHASSGGESFQEITEFKPHLPRKGLFGPGVSVNKIPRFNAKLVMSTNGRTDASQQHPLERNPGQFLAITLNAPFPCRPSDQILAIANSGYLPAHEVGVVNMVRSLEKDDDDKSKDCGIEMVKPYRNLYQTDSDRDVSIGVVSHKSLVKMRQDDSKTASKSPSPASGASFTGRWRTTTASGRRA